MKGEFTGRHMAMVVVSGFGVIIAINLVMATLAVRGFGGVVVENSYVASQEFNGWLDAAREQDALGWAADLERQPDDRLRLSTTGVPAGSKITARLRRPLGRPETIDLPFAAVAPDSYLSRTPVPSGRWIVRIGIVSGDRRWVQEARIE